MYQCLREYMYTMWLFIYLFLIFRLSDYYYSHFLILSLICSIHSFVCSIFYFLALGFIYLFIYLFMVADDCICPYWNEDFIPLCLEVTWRHLAFRNQHHQYGVKWRQRYIAFLTPWRVILRCVVPKSRCGLYLVSRQINVIFMRPLYEAVILCHCIINFN